ncbi:MAG: sugar phosphate isomerase/epimerase [Oscillospiraceae bacterium]|jgi:sugar phosphate isomerase/epimerase
MITSGISTASLYPKYTEDALYELAVRGVDLVEIFLNSDSELKKPFIDELKIILDGHGTNVSSIHPYTCGIEPLMFFTQYERRFLDILDYYKKYFEIMNQLGAKIFVFHGNKDVNVFPDDKYFERFQKLCQVGREFGITVAHENVARCSGGSLDFLKNMIAALGDDAKIVFDTKQAVRRGYDPYLFMSEIYKNIAHIHISDYSEKGDCLLIGEGKLNFNKFIEKLNEYSYTGSIILELYSYCYTTYDELSQNLSYFRGIIENSCQV